VAVPSAGPYASLHLAPNRQPCQHPTTQFFTGQVPFLPICCIFVAFASYRKKPSLSPTTGPSPGTLYPRALPLDATADSKMMLDTVNSMQARASMDIPKHVPSHGGSGLPLA